MDKNLYFAEIIDSMSSTSQKQYIPASTKMLFIIQDDNKEFLSKISGYI